MSSQTYTVGPGETVEGFFGNAPASGLPFGVQVKDGQGGVVIARTTAGVIEDPPGSRIYNYTLTAPTIAGSYFVFGDDGGSPPTFADDPDTIVVTHTIGTSPVYATLAEVKAALELTGETFADPDIGLAIEAASRGLDRALGTRFYAVAEQRFFTPAAGNVVFLDEVSNVTAFAVDDTGGTYTTWAEGTDFILGPLNATADGVPYTNAKPIRRTGRCFPTHEGAVRVDGTFGWVTVPAPIKAATMILASRLLRRVREAPFGVVAVGIDAEAAMTIARTDPDIRTLTATFERMH